MIYNLARIFLFFFYLYEQIDTQDIYENLANIDHIIKYENLKLKPLSKVENCPKSSLSEIKSNKEVLNDLKNFLQTIRKEVDQPESNIDEIEVINVKQSSIVPTPTLHGKEEINKGEISEEYIFRTIHSIDDEGNEDMRKINSVGPRNNKITNDELEISNKKNNSIIKDPERSANGVADLKKENNYVYNKTVFKKMKIVPWFNKVCKKMKSIDMWNNLLDIYSLHLQCNIDKEDHYFYKYEGEDKYIAENDSVVAGNISVQERELSGESLSSYKLDLDSIEKVEMEIKGGELKKFDENITILDSVGIVSSSIAHAADEKDQLETYSEFAERVTAEKMNGGSTSISGGNGQSQNLKGPKVKDKNYASPDCGAKLTSANSESQHSKKIINSNKDEYMLNKCSDDIWAVVELCESIQPLKFDVANFELFSNLPKSLSFYGGHRHPTREWVFLGTFEGKEDTRDIQSFNVNKTDQFFKYVKLEVSSYYGTEFYCPLSLFRVYGLSEFEVIDHLDIGETDDVESEEILEEPLKDAPKDRDGVIPNVLKSMVTGVLDAIKRGSRRPSKGEHDKDLSSFTYGCQSLHSSYSLQSSICPLADSLNYILACYYQEYTKLLNIPYILKTVQDQAFCEQLASSVCHPSQLNDSYIYSTVCSNQYPCIVLTPKHVLAMCYIYNSELFSNSSLCENHIDGNQNLSLKIKPEDHSSFQSNNLSVSPEIIKSSNKNKSNKKKNSDAKSIPVKNISMDNNTHHVDESRNVETKVDTSKKTIANGAASVVTPDQNHTSSNQGATVDANKDESRTGKAAAGSDDIVSSGQDGRHSSHTSSSNKESIVVRLSNKIKTLEHNMSISSQYLEELSLRYKRQMEEMQRQFNVTIKALNHTALLAYERDLHHQTHIETLEKLLISLQQQMINLKFENETLWRDIAIHHIWIIVVEIAVILISFILCFRTRQRFRADQSVYTAKKNVEECIHCNRVDAMPSTVVNNNQRRKSFESAVSVKLPIDDGKRSNIEVLHIDMPDGKTILENRVVNINEKQGRRKRSAQFRRKDKQQFLNEQKPPLPFKTKNQGLPDIHKAATDEKSIEYISVYSSSKPSQFSLKSSKSSASMDDITYISSEIYNPVASKRSHVSTQNRFDCIASKDLEESFGLSNFEESARTFRPVKTEMVDWQGPVIQDFYQPVDDIKLQDPTEIVNITSTPLKPDTTGAYPSNQLIAKDEKVLDLIPEYKGENGVETFDWCESKSNKKLLFSSEKSRTGCGSVGSCFKYVNGGAAIKDADVISNDLTGFKDERKRKKKGKSKSLIKMIL